MDKAKKLKLLTKNTLANIFTTPTSYRNFLIYASKFYKYEPAQIVMAYGQDNDATMLATYQQWNDLGRRITYGSHALAIGNEGYSSLVYDVRQTSGDKLPYVWKLSDYDKADEINDIIRSDVDSDLKEKIIRYGEQLKMISADSRLQGLSDGEVSEILTGIVYDSILYTVSARCNVDISDILRNNSYLFNFNTALIFYRMSYGKCAVALNFRDSAFFI